MENLRSLPDLCALEEGNQGDLGQWDKAEKRKKTSKKKIRGAKKNKKKDNGKVRFFVATVAETFREEIEAGSFGAVFVDATFECNRKFQFVNIMARRSGVEKPVILFSILMAGRRTRDYMRVWEAIKLAFPAFEPTVFSADFERALRRSFQAVFTLAKFAGCVFHFMQAIEKRLRKLQLTASLEYYVKSAIRELIMAPTTPMFKSQLASFLSAVGTGPGSPARSGGQVPLLRGDILAVSSKPLQISQRDFGERFMCV